MSNADVTSEESRAAPKGLTNLIAVTLYALKIQTFNNNRPFTIGLLLSKPHWDSLIKI